MRAVGLRALKNHLSEYIRLAASGETVLVTDRERVVAELVAPGEERTRSPRDALLADAVRKGWLTPALGRVTEQVPNRPATRTAELLEELEADRADR